MLGVRATAEEMKAFEKASKDAGHKTVSSWARGVLAWAAGGGVAPARVPLVTTGWDAATEIKQAVHDSELICAALVQDVYDQAMAAHNEHIHEALGVPPAASEGEISGAKLMHVWNGSERPVVHELARDPAVKAMDVLESGQKEILESIKMLKPDDLLIPGHPSYMSAAALDSGAVAEALPTGEPFTGRSWDAELTAMAGMDPFDAAEHFKKLAAGRASLPAGFKNWDRGAKVIWLDERLPL